MTEQNLDSHTASMRGRTTSMTSRTTTVDRAQRPRYARALDELRASGVLRMEDRRVTRPPTGRRYR